jgi:uncharacterized RDD family membrane protein YckC
MNVAGVGTRVIIFWLIPFIIFLIAYGLYKWNSFYARFWQYKFYPYYQVFYATLFVYYLLFELLWKRTPGKLLSLTKVVDVSGKKPAWYQVVIRSLLRLTLIDAFFIPIIKKPLHDALSKTKLVEV